MSIRVSVDEDGRSIDRKWIARAMELLEAERIRSSNTPLLRLSLPEFPRVEVYIKDESVHPSGSIKHRLAHALFVHAICNGDVFEGTTVVQSSTGATAIALAWFARALGLPFLCAVPAATPPARIAALRWAGAEIVKVDPGEDPTLAGFRIAGEHDGHFMNPFARASDVSDWRSSSTLAASLFDQALLSIGAPPHWVITGVGTGATSATLGRYMRFRPELAATRLCVVDPEHSAYFDSYVAGDWSVICDAKPLVDGIGRGQVEAGFCPSVIDRMISVSDRASIAGMRWLAERMGRRFGPSTGTNIVGALLMASAMEQHGQGGSIVTLACSSGDGLSETFYSDDWLRREGVQLGDWNDLLRKIGSYGLKNL